MNRFTSECTPCPLYCCCGVEVPILLGEREICAFKIHGQEAPFEAEVLNRTSGEGVLRARGPIDCEQQKEYTFIIQAYDCGASPSGADWKKSHKGIEMFTKLPGAPSVVDNLSYNSSSPQLHHGSDEVQDWLRLQAAILPAVVHIQVDDVNEFSPVFREPLYRATVTEGKISDSILQVEAWDQDCSPQYSQICNYEIVTQETPFAIDRNDAINSNETWSGSPERLTSIPHCCLLDSAAALIEMQPAGNIRNTERLSYDKQQHYKIMVTAYDCGQKRAMESVPVHIEVKPVCKPGWQGWNKRMDYEPGTGSKQLFPKMHLETCDGPLSSVRAMVELQTSHIGKGCDRETYSEKSLQKLCGAASGSTDLLPAPSASTNWTASLLTDSGRDSDLIFRFDGRQAANIPDWVVPQNLTDQFTIATWMKHGPSPGLRAEKETLLCNSDKTEMNRHHYSLYVHNCRLVFLLRRDFIQLDSFRPAEFHWRLE
ncbi:hypothetical protein DNTS_026153, partial [Danionella cerebrum]